MTPEREAEILDAARERGNVHEQRAVDELLYALASERAAREKAEQEAERWRAAFARADERLMRVHAWLGRQSMNTVANLRELLRELDR